MENDFIRMEEEKELLSCGFTKEDFHFMMDMLQLLKDEYPCSIRI